MQVPSGQSRPQGATARPADPRHSRCHRPHDRPTASVTDADGAQATDRRATRAGVVAGQRRAAVPRNGRRSRTAARAGADELPAALRRPLLWRLQLWRALTGRLRGQLYDAMTRKATRCHSRKEGTGAAARTAARQYYVVVGRSGDAAAPAARKLFGSIVVCVILQLSKNPITLSVL